MSRNPERLILIHGAWAGAWVWDELVSELANLGREAVAIELPGNGAHPMPLEEVSVEDYYSCLDNVIISAPGPVALVGHSGGGMLVTAGAARHPNLVCRGIWIAGMLIPDGRSFDDLCEEVVGSNVQIGVSPHVAVAPDGLSTSVPVQTAMKYFFHDLPREQAKSAAARLRPQPTTGRRIATSVEQRFDSLPKLYVQATEDRSVLPEVQRKMCEGIANLEVKGLQCGHVPQIVKPLQLARMIDDWLRKSECTIPEPLASRETS